MALNDREIGMRVRNIRKEHKLTQVSFARKFHMTQQTLSRYENGRISIPIGTLESIAEGMNVSVGYFLGVDASKFTDDELRLINIYRRVDDRMKEYMLEMALMAEEKLQGKNLPEQG